MRQFFDIIKMMADINILLKNYLNYLEIEKNKLDGQGEDITEKIDRWYSGPPHDLRVRTLSHVRRGKGTATYLQD